MAKKLLISIICVFILVFSVCLVSAEVYMTNSGNSPRLIELQTLVSSTAYQVGYSMGQFDAANDNPKAPHFTLTLLNLQDDDEELYELYTNINKDKGNYLLGYKKGHADYGKVVEALESTASITIKTVISEEAVEAVSSGQDSSYDYGYTRGYLDSVEGNSYDPHGYFAFLEEHKKEDAYSTVYHIINDEHSRFLAGYQAGYDTTSAKTVKPTYVQVEETTTYIDPEGYDVVEDNPMFNYASELYPYKNFDPYTIGLVIGYSDGVQGKGKTRDYIISQLKYRQVNDDAKDLYETILWNKGEYYIGYAEGHALGKTYAE